MDVMPPEARSALMSRIRGKDTRPELLIRRGLHALGFRYRLHRTDLPGTPDIILPKHRAVVFVHGCFWHGHEGCPAFRLPGSRPEFWKSKIERNAARDERDRKALLAMDWRVMTVWECALRGPNRLGLEIVIGNCAIWILEGRELGDLSSKTRASKDAWQSMDIEKLAQRVRAGDR